jgi:lipopolysaccharide transport system ATP-binding protein
LPIRSEQGGDIAVSVEGLSKRYVLGEREPYKTLRSSLMSVPNRLLRQSSSVSPVGGRAELWALRDLSFQLRQGEVLGIVGHNGAGKSTLLKILSRVTSPTNGRVVLRGRASALLEVGTGFHPELTGRENVYLNGSVLGMRQSEIARKFDEIVDFAGVSRFIDTPIKRYSSGMQVRLAFAVAAFLEPEILIVDEVLAVGDAAFQRKCLGKLKSSSVQGRTVLFVSHNLPAVRSLCTRAILLDHGQLVMDASPAATIEHYLSEKIGSSDSWDLRTSRRSDLELGGKARFRSLKLAGVSRAGSIPVGDTLSLQIEFEVLESVEDMVAVLNILTVDDVLVAQSVTTNSYSPVTRLDPGLYSLVARIESALLQPGRYEVGLGLRSGSMLQDQIDAAGMVEFIESVDLEFPWFGGAGGYLRLPVQWTRPEILHDLRV